MRKSIVHTTSPAPAGNPGGGDVNDPNGGGNPATDPMPEADRGSVELPVERLPVDMLPPAKLMRGVNSEPIAGGWTGGGKRCCAANTRANMDTKRQMLKTEFPSTRRQQLLFPFDYFIVCIHSERPRQ